MMWSIHTLFFLRNNSHFCWYSDDYDSKDPADGHARVKWKEMTSSYNTAVIRRFNNPSRMQHL